MKEYDLKDLIFLNPSNPKEVKSNTIDETNNTYGALTVLGCTRLKGDRKLSWVCQCKCGRIVCVYGSDLRKHKITSCGHRCDKIQDLSGQTFGYLKVLELDPHLPQTFADRSYHWKCYCTLCGNITSVSQRNLKNGNTISCGCIKSKGELKIRQLLIANNISFETEKTFESCRFPSSNNLAKFDFYIQDKYLIEYDGSQHFIETYWNHDVPLKERKEKDEYKNQWCKAHNIPLIRIPYSHYNFLIIEDLKLETSKYII